MRTFSTGKPSSWRNTLLGASMGGLGGAAAGYASTSDQKKKLRRALAGMAAGGTVGGYLGAATGYRAGQAGLEGRLNSGQRLNNLVRGLKFSSFINHMEKEAQWAWLGSLASRLGGSLARRGGTFLPRLGTSLQRGGAKLVLSSPLARRMPAAASAEATSVFNPRSLRMAATPKPAGLPARGAVVQPTSAPFQPPGSFTKIAPPLRGEAGMAPMDAELSRSLGMSNMTRQNLQRVGMPLHEVNAVVPAMMRGDAAAMSQARTYFDRFAQGRQTILPESPMSSIMRSPTTAPTSASPVLKVTPSSPISQPSLTPGPVVGTPSSLGRPTVMDPSFVHQTTLMTPSMPTRPPLPGLDQTLPPKLIPSPVPMPAFAPA